MLQRLRVGAVLQPDPRRAADGPLPAAVRPRVQPGRGAAATTSACRCRRRPWPTGSRRPATPRGSSASGTSAAAPSSTRRSAVSTSSSGSSAAPTPISPSKSEDIYRGTEPVKETDYLTDAFGREAVAFIDRHKGGPFFLEVAFNAVHTPMDATDARLARFASIPDKTRRTYAAMLSALDDAVGAVLDKLREAGLEEDTLIVFISDNGGPTMLGTTINGSRNDPAPGLEADHARRRHPRPVRRELEGQAARRARSTTSP